MERLNPYGLSLFCISNLFIVISACLLEDSIQPKEVKTISTETEQGTFIQLHGGVCTKGEKKEIKIKKKSLFFKKIVIFFFFLTIISL